jgi:hypothetical protein
MDLKKAKGRKKKLHVVAFCDLLVHNTQIRGVYIQNAKGRREMFYNREGMGGRVDKKRGRKGRKGWRIVYFFFLAASACLSASSSALAYKIH